MKKHGNLCFALLAGAILLAGALGAWSAARAVTAPRTGEVISAGAAPVPSVLGQTADEVLLPPWPRYETEPLNPLPEEIRNLDPSLTLEDALILMTKSPDLAPVPRLASELLGLEPLEEADFWRTAEISSDPNFAHIFLRRFPCRLVDGEEVVLDYAQDDQSVSFVISAKEPEEAGREAQDAALAKVREDLRRFLSGTGEDGGIREALLPLAEYTDEHFGMSTLLQLMELPWCIAYDITPEKTEGRASDQELVVYPFSLEEADLDTLLQQMEGYGWSVQLVAAPHQVVTLISSQYAVVGIYYDVQLERYSGFGVSESWE